MTVRNIGGDFGFGQVCLYCADSGVNKVVRFPSVVVPVDATTASLRDEDIFVDTDGRKYLVGEEAAKSRPESRSTDTAFFFGPDYRILVLAGLRRMLGSSKGDVRLVTGLPIEHYTTHRKRYEETLMSMDLGGIKITKLRVMAQPSGVLADPLLYDMNGELRSARKGKVLVIDGGYGTIDMAAYENSNVMTSGTFGANYGAKNIHEKVFAALQTVKIKNKTTGKTEVPAFPKDFVVRSIDKVMREKGFRLAGDWYELDERHYKPAFDEYLGQIRDIVERRWGNLNGFDWVIFAGGVADMMGREYIAQNLVPPKILLMPKESENSIARGFAAIATLTAQQGM